MKDRTAQIRCLDCCVAIVLLAVATVCSPGQPAGENLAEEARKLAAAGDYKEAVRIYQLLAAREPRSASVFINLGVAYAKLGQFSLAANAYRTALGIDPKSVPAWINLGVAEFKAGRFAHAINPLETAIQLDPSNRQAQTLLAMSHFSLHQFEPAARYFEPLLRGDPANSTIQYLLGECYFRSHQQQRLEALVQEVSKSSPDSVALHLLAGEAYDRLNRIDEAIEEFRAAEKSDPGLPRLHFYLGYLYWEEKHYAEAEAEFDAERPVPNGEGAQAEGYLADIAAKNGDTKRAEELSRSAIRKDRCARIAHLNLAIIAAQQKRWAEAENGFRTAIALDPNRADAYYRLAGVYRAQGKVEQQKAMLSKVKQVIEGQRLSAGTVLSGCAPQSYGVLRDIDISK
jgi:tetratricopeptide (TPR) repeat protein